ncbi:tRNA (cytidine(34)-2'-O)-methyltransferase [Parachlamydia sp. AcF125]|uniref:tRNA (cytidine(34)-2'-O)-methyltransferase n=1 Tax=Parachlamydia sp. AcF125 TaxID=2795736 RepID=UPI001BC9E998|nr:tRNA (cytidine(34)-2'-O)-methyltransferase [Parachlamydia sp. AcF125]
MTVVLYQPQIPQNTGNIVRTCAVTGKNLILIAPLGFSVTDRWLKRAGLDYWEGVNVQILDNLEELLAQTKQNFYFFSSHARIPYTEVSYHFQDLLIFGAETHGLPSSITQKWPERCVKIPMISGVRCLNLATSVGIGVYEAWRQQGFKKE